MDYNKESLKLHQKLKGKLEIKSKVLLKTRSALSIAYTPGVAEPCRQIFKNKSSAYKYTIKSNSVAVVTDGSAVLGLGNIGPEAALPVMEGKAILFKEFGNVDAYPICIDTQDPEKFIETVKMIAPSFGGINLEDISALRCFEIEKRLDQELDIPVFHDDQHGTAIVVLAGLINALKVVKKQKEKVRVVISGAGAAGIAVSKLLFHFGFKNIIVCDSKGIISKNRRDLNQPKKEILKLIPNRQYGDLDTALKSADIFIGVSAPGIVTPEMIEKMNPDPIIFAMSNPIPEIMPDLAKKAGAKVVATGRSDFPNQINNVLVFPGIFRGALDARLKITPDMKIATALALSGLVKNPTPNKIIPSVFEKRVVGVISQAIKKRRKRNF